MADAEAGAEAAGTEAAGTAGSVAAAGADVAGWASAGGAAGGASVEGAAVSGFFPTYQDDDGLLNDWNATPPMPSAATRVSAASVIGPAADGFAAV